ncbi:hypothetical protein [Leeia aquatica]|uniref:Uncharacterized protein n=1 Tax=Leeia aquatica TaxID=2725557 RepID=A0A847S885_9NEIS|nr:hypothetical protein [Leeia aquatica]NLR73549.1 hypothetical protein [Leeia aquatica]
MQGFRNLRQCFARMLQALDHPDVVSAEAVVCDPANGKAMEALVILQGEHTDIFLEHLAMARDVLSTGTASRFDEAGLHVVITCKGNPQ